MSSIKIECRKDKSNFDDTKDYNKHVKENKLGDELVIESSQLFMNTEKFFNTVKASLEKYFDNIQKK